MSNEPKEGGCKRGVSYQTEALLLLSEINITVAVLLLGRTFHDPDREAGGGGGGRCCVLIKVFVCMCVCGGRGAQVV